MALFFEGTNDAITHTDIDALDTAAAFTVMFWMQRLGTADGDLFSKTTSVASNGFFCDHRPASDIRFFIGSVSGVWPTSLIPDLTAFYHYAFMFNGAGADDLAKLKVYRDGVEIAATSRGTIPTSCPDSTTGLVRLAGGVLAFLDATLAHVKIYNAALTEAEIMREVYSYRPARTANLLVWAPYDDGTSARDYSGNGSHGTLVDAPAQISGPPVSFGAAVMVL